MNIFVTGGTGFLGKSIVRALLTEGYAVTCLLLPGDDAASAAGAAIRRGDITRPDTLRGTTGKHDAIVHLAGAVGYGQTWENCIRLNRDGTANIAEEAVFSGVKRFVHMSSVSVYGRVSGTPISESFPLKKIKDPYGDTKIDAERALAPYAKNGALDLTIIRPTMIYGPGDTLFLPKVAENIKTGKARIIGKGDHRVDCIHVSDVAAFVLAVLRSDRAVGKIYNLTHPDNPTWEDMIADIARALDMPVPGRHIPYGVAYVLAGCMEAASFFTRKPPRLTRYAVRNVGKPYDYLTDQMKQDLAFSPSVSLRQGIHEYIAGIPK
ncbi:MAG: NAD-dependent epimerase/dehydratase family protein [Desulfobacteraceae bacterium]|jgi:nucleoside-diphosphate-sugar epimerase|nr:MAG: NAD-dependent epimerase/dehydratase family protein [Desulfobacteraceae bacterium]